MSDETPEGRSIVVLAKKQFGIRGRHMDADHIAFIPFPASTRMSGVDIAEHDGHPAEMCIRDRNWTGAIWGMLLKGLWLLPGKHAGIIPCLFPCRRTIRW